MQQETRPKYWLTLIALVLFLGTLPCYLWAQGSASPQRQAADSARIGPRPTNARIVPGSEILVSRDEDFAHVETMLVANPADRRHLLASCIITPKDHEGQFLFRTRAYVSRDSGKTWKASPLPDENLWDPIVAFTPRGTALFRSLPRGSLSVFCSEDGGSAWKDRFELGYTMAPMIAVDWTDGPRRGHIYIAGRGAARANAPFVVRRSSDDGRTFETTVVIQETYVSQALNPIVLQDGMLLVPFSTMAGNDVEQIDCVRSSDGGRTFSQPSRIATRRIDTKGRHGDWSPAVFASGLHAGKERLYVVYAVYRGDANARLVLSRSDDGGRTWSEARDIAPGTADELTHGAANVAVDRSGVVGISWLERKIGPIQQDYKEGEQVAMNFNETYNLLFTASLDGGDTFLGPMRIASRSSKPVPRHASRFWPGLDYMLSAAASNGTFHVLWPDARAGIFQLYACAVRVEYLNSQ